MLEDANPSPTALGYSSQLADGCNDFLILIVFQSVKSRDDWSVFTVPLVS
jgi:hypothetical protein